jgi:cytoskeletal protein RodZ
MALSMDEQRMLAEIERRLADDDPVLAARLTSFRLPRLTLATRSARSRLMTSLLMLVVVGVVAVFVYALIPFRSQADRAGPAHTTASHSATASPGASSAPPARSASSPAGSPAQSPAHQRAAAIARSAASSPFTK